MQRLAVAMLLMMAVSGCFGSGGEATPPGDSGTVSMEQDVVVNETRETPDDSANAPPIPPPVEPDVVENVTKADVGPSFVVIDTGARCPGFCEPTIAHVGHTIVVATTQGDLLRSTPEGFEQLSLPSHPTGAFAASRGDEMVHAGPDGSLWYTALLVNQASGAGVYRGLQVARSMDAGESWQSNVGLTLSDEPEMRSFGADRQWLGFLPDGTAYLLFQSIPVASAGVDFEEIADQSNVYWSKSTDGGETWQPFAPLDEGGGAHIHGAPVHAGGTLWSVFHRYGEGAGVCIAQVDGNQPRDCVASVGAWFPAIAATSQGLHVAYIDGKDELQLVQQVDVEWVAQSIASIPVASPWIVGGSRLDMVWMERNGTDRFDLRGWREGESFAIAQGFVDNGERRSNSDFVHFVKVDERIHAVTSDRETGAVLLLVEQA